MDPRKAADHPSRVESRRLTCLRGPSGMRMTRMDGAERMAFVEVFDLFGENRRTDLAGLMERAARRDAEGCNHLEIARVGERYPMLGVRLKGDYAVVLYIEDEGSDMQVLRGGASFGKDEIVQFQGPDGRESYTGDVIVSFPVAEAFLNAFVSARPWPEWPGWLTL